ncbi:MAG: glycosyltransferase [Segetibacter sp.]|nr:glycosyltransferase [Segetibacter sp.]
MGSAFNTILIISSEFPPNVGGIGNHAYNLAKALAAEGFEVSVVADIIDVDENELMDFSSKQAFKIHWINRKRFVVQTYLGRVFKALALSKKAGKIICSGKFPLWVAILIRIKYPRKELTAVVHGTELDFKLTVPKKLTSYSLRKFNKIISVSNYTQQFLPGTLPSSVRKFIIHNGINGSEFAIKEISTLCGTPALITVGNVTERKGQENVINALPEILVDYPSVRYHIVGKPTDKEKIENRAKKLQVKNNIQFYGAVSRDELLKKLKGAAIKLMLSNHTAEGDFEGFGIAVLEANAFGVPAIGSKDCGIADAIVHGKTGLLVDQYNPKEVAEAIKIIMNDYSCFSNNAKAWAVQHDWKIIVKKYIAVLND